MRMEHQVLCTSARSSSGDTPFDRHLVCRELLSKRPRHAAPSRLAIAQGASASGASAVSVGAAVLSHRRARRRSPPPAPHPQPWRLAMASVAIFVAKLWTRPFGPPSLVAHRRRLGWRRSPPRSASTALRRASREAGILEPFWLKPVLAQGASDHDAAEQRHLRQARPCRHPHQRRRDAPASSRCT